MYYDKLNIILCKQFYYSDFLNFNGNSYFYNYYNYPKITFLIDDDPLVEPTVFCFDWLCSIDYLVFFDCMRKTRIIQLFLHFHIFIRHQLLHSV